MTGNVLEADLQKSNNVMQFVEGLKKLYTVYQQVWEINIQLIEYTICRCKMCNISHHNTYHIISYCILLDFL